MFLSTGARVFPVRSKAKLPEMLRATAPMGERIVTSRSNKTWMAALPWLAVLGLACNGAASPKAGRPGAEGPVIPEFTDVLKDSGITFRHHVLDTETGTIYKVNAYDHGSGLCVVNVNGNGRDDIYFLDFKGRNHLYLNQGNYKFEDVTERSGLGVGRAVCTAAAFGDFDNDGNIDVYVTTYRCGNKLFRNRGNGTFEDVTVKAGVGYQGNSSSCTWLDYNNDGLLDLLVCNVGKFTLDTISKEADYFYEGVNLDLLKFTVLEHNLGEGLILFRNNGNGTFTNVTTKAGLGISEWNGNATVADFDQDGYLDVYVTNMFATIICSTTAATARSRTLQPRHWDGPVGRRWGEVL